MSRDDPKQTIPAFKTTESLRQLEAYFISLPDAILVWDRAGKLTFLNAAALKLFEIQATDSWLGTSAQQFLQRYTWCDEQQRPFSFASESLLDLSTFKKEAESLPYEQTLVLASPPHHKVWLNLLCSPVCNNKLQPIGVLATFRVIAPRYQEALHIQRVYQALMTLKKAIAQMPGQFQKEGKVSDIAFLYSPPVLFIEQQLVNVVRQTLACWCVSLIGFRAPGFHMTHMVGSGYTAEQEHFFRSVPWHFRFTDFFDGATLARLQANQEVLLEPGRFCIPTEYPDEFGEANLLMLPLIWKQKLAGMLVIHKHQWEGEYTPDEVELVKAVNAHIRLFIECLGLLQTSLVEQARDLVLPEVDRLSSDFLTLASHELRTPLTVTKGNLQLAQRRVERLKRELAQQSERAYVDLEQAQQSLDAAAQSIRLQERLVQDMLDDARIQAGHFDVMLAPCDLLALVKQAVEQQQKAMPKRAISLKILTLKPTVPIMADAGRIIQVLIIYLNTALTSSPAEQPVAVQVQEEKEMARVSVHDEGPGIPLEEQIRLWDRFYRGKGSSVQHELDLSLGLRFYLCRALIERHHGTVGVQSTPGQGTTFWLTLPTARLAGTSTICDSSQER